jgi:hypothetical protein
LSFDHKAAGVLVAHNGFHFVPRQSFYTVYLVFPSTPSATPIFNTLCYSRILWMDNVVFVFILFSRDHATQGNLEEK